MNATATGFHEFFDATICQGESDRRRSPAPSASPSRFPVAVVRFGPEGLFSGGGIYTTSRPDYGGSVLRQECHAPLPARAAVFLLLCVLAFSVQAGVREVGAIGLTVNDLEPVLPFYTNILPFELISLSELSGKDLDELFDLKNVRLRVVALKLGDERITLTEHLHEVACCARK